MSLLTAGGQAGEIPPGSMAQVRRYADADGTGDPIVLRIDHGQPVDALRGAAERLSPGELLLVVGNASGGGAHRRVRRWTKPLRANGFEPLGWHPGDSADYTLYARRVAAEPGIPASERGGPKHPPQIPQDPVDVERAVTEDLYALAASTNLCDWMFEQYEDFVRGSVLEVGAGIGTFSERIIARRPDRLLLLEPAESCLPDLHSRFDPEPDVEIVSELLPHAPSLRPESFDLIVCQNVLEHIAADLETIRVMAEALRPGGRLALLVPAHPALFGGLDESYGHYRRYTRARIRLLFDQAGLELAALRSFNLLGILGWWVKNRRPGTHIDARSLRVYELLVRLWRPAENLIRPPWGLSLVAHGVPRRGS